MSVSDFFRELMEIASSEPSRTIIDDLIKEDEPDPEPCEPPMIEVRFPDGVTRLIPAEAYEQPLYFGESLYGGKEPHIHVWEAQPIHIPGWRYSRMVGNRGVCAHEVGALDRDRVTLEEIARTYRVVGS